MSKKADIFCGIVRLARFYGTCGWKENKGSAKIGPLFSLSCRNVQITAPSFWVGFES